MDETNGREIRWPQKEDRLFEQTGDGNANAEIAGHVRNRLWLMISGYKLAGDLMVERASGDRFERDSLVYPIVFNYRHFIELSLKELIALYGPEVGVKANWKSHELDVLWDELVKVLGRYGSSGEVDLTVAKLVLEFAKMDHRSFSFRYPVDKKGRKIALGAKELDLAVLADTMQGLENYFLGTGDYLDALKRSGP